MAGKVYIAQSGILICGLCHKPIKYMSEYTFYRKQTGGKIELIRAHPKCEKKRYADERGKIG